MSFIRAKEIPPRSGNWYDYEVMTVHEGGRVIQKVIRYIGKSELRPSRSDLSIYTDIVALSTEAEQILECLTENAKH